MATKKLLKGYDPITLESFTRHMTKHREPYDHYDMGYVDAVDNIEYWLEANTVDAVEMPCKIGDFVWAIRKFKGKKHPQRGIVSDMYFLKDMSLQIVVKYVARGKWGETVFATDKEAYAAIGGRKDNDNRT